MATLARPSKNKGEVRITVGIVIGRPRNALAKASLWFYAPMSSGGMSMKKRMYSLNA